MADTELITQFMAFSGCDDGDKARQYLEMSDMNVEVAVGLYMEHQAGGGGGIGSGAGVGDAAAAAALQDVRAADPTRRMRLMDSYGPSDVMGMMEDDLPVMSAFAQALNARDAVNAAAAAAAASSSSSSPGSDDNAGTNGEANNTAVPPASLSNMFAAPSHLMHKGGGFQGARNIARDARRWLLVNLQRDSEFSSHALNRDVWRDELVENLVREGFIFWQAMDNSDEGRTFAERYKVYDFPHISIIDPRTGRLLYRKEGWTQEKPFTAEAFAEMAMDFCSRHSFDKEPTAHLKKASRPQKRPMTEQEQLQAAMAASLKRGDSKVDDEDDDESVEYIMDEDDDDDEVVCLGTADEMDSQPTEVNPQSATPPQPKEPTFIEQLLGMTVADEPVDGARVQIRMPDSKRLVRKFAKEDLVKMIYAFVAQNNDEARGGREFLLMAGFPPKDLEQSIDTTIHDCGLSGQAITVRWKD